MRFRDWATRVMLIFFMFAALVLALFVGGSRQTQSNNTTSIPETTAWSQYPQAQLQSVITTENKENKKLNLLKSPVNTHTIPKLSKVNTIYATTATFFKYRPNFAKADVHPSNYGERFSRDVNGVPLNNQAVIVIHETSNSASSAINFFQTPHDDENVQASYHALVTLDGTVVYLVPPEKRAFGAGNSVFEGVNGLETVQTNQTLPPSINNFAYHVSLETPSDAWGKNDIQGHSGYTDAQYNSLAWLIAQSQVPDDRITTHRAVDRSGQRADPKSFDFEKFFNVLHSYRQLRTVNTANK
ncbi:peptidoglycan recognition family protein [Anabaena cylindrica UHCC 0172]|uniref:peptidoglycan recognition protein family protein n=1 Tax=Anabaena cylindrica TaxID=1165 RepID=UPI002B1F519F|nr:peptidoglycan recognition family protein [Anabaena cylindrica]MEA5551986.1 peptidoglycan recognition family protein [Anabaena cylindrica UHCC 0172]